MFTISHGPHFKHGDGKSWLADILDFETFAEE